MQKLYIFFNKWRLNLYRRALFYEQLNTRVYMCAVRHCVLNAIVMAETDTREQQRVNAQTHVRKSLVPIF